MAEQKSYNKSALRGYDYDDKEWQADMAEIEVFIPDSLLYTKEGPEFVMKHYRKTNEEGYLKTGMAPSEASITANRDYATARKGYTDLLNKK